MFTFILTIVGVFVFFISCFTVGFVSAWKRLCRFAITGFVIDVLCGIILTIVIIAPTYF